MGLFSSEPKPKFKEKIQLTPEKPLPFDNPKFVAKIENARIWYAEPEDPSKDVPEYATSIISGYTYKGHPVLGLAFLDQLVNQKVKEVKNPNPKVPLDTIPNIDSPTPAGPVIVQIYTVPLTKKDMLDIEKLSEMEVRVNFFNYSDHGVVSKYQDYINEKESGTELSGSSYFKDLEERVTGKADSKPKENVGALTNNVLDFIVRKWLWKEDPRTYGDPKRVKKKEDEKFMAKYMFDVYRTTMSYKYPYPRPWSDFVFVMANDELTRLIKEYLGAYSKYMKDKDIIYAYWHEKKKEDPNVSIEYCEKKAFKSPSEYQEYLSIQSRVFALRKQIIQYVKPIIDKLYPPKETTKPKPRKKKTKQYSPPNLPAQSYIETAK